MAGRGRGRARGRGGARASHFANDGREHLSQPPAQPDLIADVQKSIEQLGNRLENVISHQVPNAAENRGRRSRSHSHRRRRRSRSRSRSSRSSSISNSSRSASPPKKGRDKSRVKPDGLRFETNRSQMRFMGDLQKSLDRVADMVHKDVSSRRIRKELDSARDVLRKRSNHVRICDNYGYNVGRVFEAGTGLDLENEERNLLQQAICANMMAAGPSTSMGMGPFRGRGGYNRGSQYGSFPGAFRGRRADYGSRGAYGNSAGESIICFHCKQPGHVRNQCPLYTEGMAAKTTGATGP